MGEAMVSRRTSCPTCEELIAPLPSDLVDRLETGMREAAGEANLEDALRATACSLAQLTRADRCSVLAPIGKDSLRVLASSEVDQLGDIIISLDLYPELAHLLRSHEPILVSDVSADEMLRPVHHLMRQSGTVSLAAAPFQLAGVTSILRIASRSRSFSMRDLHILGAAAHLTEHRIPERPASETSCWQDMVLQMTDGIVDISLDGRIVHVSGPLCDRLGVAPEQVSGKYLDEVLQDQQAGDARRRLIGLLEGGTTRDGIVFRTRFPGRSAVRIQVWGTRIGGPDLRARIGVRCLDEEPTPGDELFQSAPIPLIAIERSSKTITAVNSFAESLCKTSAADLVGRGLSSLLQWNKGQARLRRPSLPSAPVRVVQASASPEDSDVSVVALVDLRRQREAQMRETLQRQNDELASLQKRLDELESMRTQFLATSAHELKTPITVIQSYLEILMDDLAEGLTEQQISFLQVTYEGVLRLRRLVTDLVDLAALQGGKLQLTIRRVETVPVVSSVIDEMQALAQRAGVSLRAEQLDALPPLRADSDRVEQVLRNLIDNAIKNTPVEGVVTVSGREERDSVVLHVCDTGVGIPPDQIPLVFDEFTQVNPVRDRGRQGSGLGLTISRRIVQALGGRIEVESEENVGSVFSVFLPQWPDPDR
jgi:signal transduction histidine kinase